MGLAVARLGGPEQKPLPFHENIFDFAGADPSLRTDLQVLASSSVVLFTDSGFWPMAVGLGKRTIISDVVSDQGNFASHRAFPHAALRVNRSRTDVFGWTHDDLTTVLRKRRLSLGPFSLFIPNSTRKLLRTVIGQIGSNRNLN